MTDVLLSDSIGQLRSHLRAGEYSDALAVGRHILQTYPKHLETYALLAQACLETNDLANAADLFRRVLSADPENVLALVGMALLNEAQDKPDEALWYLERAFEIQPSNDELRRELLRVRELYYGTTPPRLELTAGALARLYARQGQYAQAVNEFRRLLREDRHRYDTRVALAEVLFRAGRKDQAAQVAQTVIEDAPYALKPNLILGALWLENDVPEGERFMQRALALDPENRVARDLIGERLGETVPPRLPAMREPEESAYAAEMRAAQLPPNQDIARAAELLREIERGGETQALGETQEPLFAELDAMGLIESEPLAQTEMASLQPTPEPANAISGTSSSELFVTATAAAAGEEIAGAITRSLESESAETIAGTAPSEISSEGQAQHPPEGTPSESRAATAPVRQKTASGAGKQVPADAIAAAVAALATSIALDKTNQPAPVRRAHPAIPKVRPVIRGAQEKLPPWLRLAATPAAAPASFDPMPQSDADLIAPLGMSIASSAPPPTAEAADDRPDWLVRAQAAVEQQTILPQTGSDLPEWLRDTAPSPTAENQMPAADASQITLPDWLQVDTLSETPNEPESPSPALATLVTGGADTTAAGEENPSVVERPDWLRDSVELVQSRTNPDALPNWLQEPAPGAMLNQETAPVVNEQSHVPTQALPDSATMLAMAREKSAKGDVKGALDLYERVMHRRPNHLDEVIGDLQEIVRSGDASSTAHRLLGEAYAMAGRFKESLEQYRLAMGK